MATADSLVERRPGPRLAPFAAAVWVQHVDAGAEPSAQLSIPHGGVELSCVLGDPPTVSGPRTRPSVRTLVPGSTVIGIRFAPGCAFDWSAGDLLDASVTAGELWGPAASPIADALGGADDAWTSLERLEQWVADVAGLEERRDPVVDRFVAACLDGRSRDVATVRAGLGISERQLRRRCQQVVGMSPGSLLRLSRFQRFVALAQRTVAARAEARHRDLATMAAECGYADHAHLTRECRRLTGSTPSAYIAEMATGCGCRHDHRASFGRFTFWADGRSVQARRAG